MSEEGVRYSGSCVCGGVHYEFDAPPRITVMCHCSLCRKLTGSAFGTWSLVKKSGFSWTKGAELVAEFKSSEHGLRLFCRSCGSTLGSLSSRYPTFFHLATGTLDVTPPLNLGLHVYAASKADWYEISDAIPRHDTEPPRKT